MIFMHIYAFFEFCNVTLELASCLCCLEVLPTAQPNQLASLARCLGSVGAPKTELVQFYDALEDFQDLLSIKFSAFQPENACVSVHCLVFAPRFDAGEVVQLATSQ